MGRRANAEKAFLDALQVDASFSLARTFLGSLFLTRTDGDRRTNARTAKMWLEQAVAAAPNPMSLSFLGAAYDRLGEKEAAREVLQQAIEIDGSYAEAYLNLGILLADCGQNEEAETVLRTATQVAPNSHKAHGRLGVLLHDLDRCSEAETELERAVELDPSDALARSYLEDCKRREPKS